MVSWRDVLNDDPLPWLLEPDPVQPAIRYFTLRDILDRDKSDDELRDAQVAVMSSGPVPKVLDAQEPQGFWVKPGPGYSPKYRGTVWQIIFLAQLGAGGSDTRVRQGCEYLMENAIAGHGGFSVNGTPSAFIHCEAGNLSAALLDMGYRDDKRLQKALDWQVRLVTGDGVAGTDAKDTPRRYFKSSTCGPDFICAANARLPCAWGAVKAMLALGRIPPDHRTPEIRAAIDRGVEFLLSHDPAVADYPSGYSNKPSSSWFKFGYPIGYVTDVLQNLEALAALGHAQDPRLARALELVKDKQDAQGRWIMEYSYNGKTWVDIESRKQPSKWVTLRALRVLKAAYRD